MDFVLVSSFVFVLDIYFSHKKLLLINLNAEKICCNFSYKKIYSKMWELCMHPDYDHFIC